jgi:hypothetical protein
MLSVNSRERFDRPRSWLEATQAVTFKSERETTRRENRPLDDRLPPAPAPPPSKELLAEIERHIHKACMAWLDESIPALGGKTAGRQPVRCVRRRAGGARSPVSSAPIRTHSGSARTSGSRAKRCSGNWGSKLRKARSPGHSSHTVITASA